MGRRKTANDRSRKTKRKAERELEPIHIDQILLWMVAGLREVDILNRAETNWGLTRKQTEAGIVEARRRLTIAAEFNRDEEIGKAVLRLNELYVRSLAAKEPKDALAAQKELNRLLDLYHPPWITRTEGESPESPTTHPEVAASLRYLLPLNLGRPDDPLSELCRLAAARIMELETAR